MYFCIVLLLAAVDCQVKHFADESKADYQFLFCVVLPAIAS